MINFALLENAHTASAQSTSDKRQKINYHISEPLHYHYAPFLYMFKEQNINPIML